ncbi:MAG: pyruvate kinase, partial [Sedimentisphaerales bacterium]|nr:pyruvate kinase [Sedimentisphaerales bacterium]
GARPSDEQLKIDNPLQFSAVEIEAEHIIPIIAKIERPQAVANLESILEQADAVMVARGDLGVEMDLAEVPVIQKQIIHTCKQYGIPVIVATQMLQSMVDSPIPTRAEASDVANAIFDGTDAVMLSAETSVGAHPVEAVRTMNRIAAKTHNYILRQSWASDQGSSQLARKATSAALSEAVRLIVDRLDIQLLAVWSQLGGGAVYLSQQRIPRPILAFSSSDAVLRRMSMLYGLTPVHIPPPKYLDDLLGQLDHVCLQHSWARRGQYVAVLCSQPMSQIGRTNMVCLHRIGQSGVNQGHKERDQSHGTDI